MRQKIGKSLMLLFVTTSLLAGPPRATAQKIYWVYLGQTIRRADLDGSDAESLINVVNANSLAIDTFGAKIYWTNIHDHRIQRSNLDGTMLEDIVDLGRDRPWRIALCAKDGKIYWSNFDASSIQRANLDGTDVEDLVTGFGIPRALAIDATNLALYWNRGTEMLRASLDGADVESVLFDPGYPIEAIDIDAINGKIYWIASDFAHSLGGALRRSALDGSNMETLLEFGIGLIGKDIRLAVERGELYWTQAQFGLRRSNLNGGEVVNLVPSGQVSAMALYLVPCCRPFGDLFPLKGSPGSEFGDCVVDIDDVVCVLDGFVEGPKCPAADIQPCGGNGMVDVDDIVAELEAYTGYAACETQCP